MAQINIEAARQLDAHRLKRFLESLKPDLSQPGSLVRLAVLGSTAVGLASGAVVGINQLVGAIDWNKAAANQSAWFDAFFGDPHETSGETVDPATLVALEVLKTPTPTLTRTPTDTDLPPTPTPSSTKTTTSTPTDTETPTPTPTPTRTSRPTLLPTRPTAASTVTSTKEAPPVENGTGYINVNGKSCRIVGRGEGITAAYGVQKDILDWLGLSQSVAGKSEGPQGELNVDVDGNIVDLNKVPFLEVEDIDIPGAINMHTNAIQSLPTDAKSIFSGLRIGDSVYSGNPGQGESFYVGVDCP